MSQRGAEPCLQAKAAARKSADDDIAARIEALDWAAMASSLDAQGCAVTGPLLTADECAALAARYPEDALFRSRVIMARHGFGRGEYKYFAYPLPDLVAGAAHRALSAARRDRQSLERGDGHRCPLSARPRGLPRSAATRPARRGRRRCCCNTVPATTIACTRTFTASTCFRCRPRCCCRGRAPIFPAASSC